MKLNWTKDRSTAEEKKGTCHPRRIKAIVRQHALQHIKPLRNAKLVDAHAVNRFTISVTFQHDGYTQTQIVGTGVPLPNSTPNITDQPKATPPGEKG